MNLIKIQRIRHEEVGLVFRNGKLERVLEPGRHVLSGLSGALEIAVYDTRQPRIMSDCLDQIARSELTAERARFVDLKDDERALVWIEGRFEQILGPGLHGFWTAPKAVAIEIRRTDELRLVHPQLASMLEKPASRLLLEVTEVPVGMAGLLFVNGAFTEVLPSGVHALWKQVARTRIDIVDLREQVLEVAGQEIMTQDKVSLRLTAILTFRVVDPRLTVEAVAQLEPTLYREVQMVMRTEVGAMHLDALLADKESTATRAREHLARKARGFGVEVLGLGIRDIILPGDMKDLLNQVIEAQKASEANGIRRREETAAMRSQLNTARLMDENPVLMRLRELEVLEAVSKTTNLNVVLSEQGLTDRITKLI